MTDFRGANFRNDIFSKCPIIEVINAEMNPLKGCSFQNYPWGSKFVSDFFQLAKSVFQNQRENYIANLGNDPHIHHHDPLPVRVAPSAWRSIWIWPLKFSLYLRFLVIENKSVNNIENLYIIILYINREWNFPLPFLPLLPLGINPHGKTSKLLLMTKADV